MGNIKKNRIGITALKELKSKFYSEIYNHFSELSTIAEKTWKDDLELSWRDYFTDHEILSNLRLNLYQKRIDVNILAKKPEDSCLTEPTLIFPVLEDMKQALSDIKDRRDFVLDKLSDWYYRSLTPDDFQPFDWQKFTE